MSDDDAYERGMRIRREVLGDAHVDAAVARTTDFTADFQELITTSIWGGIWARPGIDRRMRSAVTLDGARRARTRERARDARARGAPQRPHAAEIKEVLLQTAVYCGAPAANGAFAIAQAVLAEEGVA